MTYGARGREAGMAAKPNSCTIVVEPLRPPKACTRDVLPSSHLWPMCVRGHVVLMILSWCHQVPEPEEGG